MQTDSTTNNQVQQFDAEGFLAFPKFATDELLTDVLTNLHRFLKDIVPSLPREHVFYDDRRDPTTLKQIQHMGDHDSWFHDLFHVGQFRQTAEVLLRGPVVPKNMQFFNKAPCIGQPTPPHQDGFYFMLEPCEAVTMWLALDDVDQENGCVRYVRGSHKRGMREHARTQTLGFSQGIVDFPTDQDRESEVPKPAEPGDLLAHHALTIHRAEGNRSTNRSRRALGFIYYSHRAREHTAAHAVYQKKLAAEMKSASRI